MGSRYLLGMSLGAAVGLYFAAEAYRKEANETRRKLIEAGKLVQYLADIIDKNDVPITEFDAIAVRALVENVKHS